MTLSNPDQFLSKSVSLDTQKSSQVVPHHLREKSKKLSTILGLLALTVTTASMTSIICITFLNSSLTSKASEIAPNSALTSPKINAIKSVSASGYIEPAGEVTKIYPTVQSARVDQLLVKEGDQVTAGQIIAILDNKDRLETALKVSQKKVKIAEAKLNQIRAGIETGYLKAQSAVVDQLQSELKGQITAQTAKIDSLKVELIGERKAQQATIKRLQAELNHADTECQRYQVLYNNGAVSSSLYESKCLEKVTLLEELTEAQSNLEKTVNSLEKNIKEAQAELQRTETTLQQKIINAAQTHQAMGKVRGVDISLAEAELQTALAEVEQAKANLGTAFVKVPNSGEILKINTHAGELVSSEGIIELGQTSQMYVIAEVYETDIIQVHPGQRATITSDGLTQPLKGIVEDIGRQIGKKDVLGTDTAADTDARVVEVKIRLDLADSRKVTGLTNLTVEAIINNE